LVNAQGATVTDAARGLEAIAGVDAHDATTVDVPVHAYSAAATERLDGLVVGVPREYFPESLDPAVRRRCDRALETLRAAAPWQRLRRASLPAAAEAEAAAAALAGAAALSPGQQRIHVRAEDFHVTPMRQHRETTTIFCVDASGSQALNRLAEAKGAVELLLADCYVRRDSVALLAFRGRTAEVLLPPTRSLVRARRSLAALPGGGGTPLAAALQATAVLAEAVLRRGDTPLVVLLTDGRANVALDGTGGRALAEADALQCAQRLRLLGCAVLLIDTSPQPTPTAARLAEALRGRYLPLPHADATRLSKAVRAAAA
jgi:magnesium chelatase subunit D